jgi:hypothetical protein
MKKFISVILFVIISLAVGLFFAQAGFAYQRWNNDNMFGCMNCHQEGVLGSATAPELHGITSHTANSCAICHNGGVPAIGNVSPSKCVVCHYGTCTLINIVPQHQQTCLNCHASCSNYSYIELLPPGWNNALAEDINNNGVVVGWGKGGESAFIYNNGQYTELIPPGWSEAVASSINDNGDVAGYGVDSSGIQKGFIYSGEKYNYLLPPGWSEAYVGSINDSGDVVGHGLDGSGIQKGFIYSGGQYTVLLPPSWVWSYATCINDNGDMVGYGQDGNGIIKGFVYSGGQYTYPKPPGWQSAGYVVSINKNGDFAGWGLDGNGIQKGFVHSGGQYTELLPPGWELIFEATCLNNKGEVVGYGQDGNGIIKGFVYSGGQYTELTPPGSLSTFVISINDNGVVVGFFDYGSPNGQKGFIATPKAPPSCVSVSPSSGMRGQTLDVTIIGSNTNFIDTGSTANSTTVSFGCDGITVNSTTVRSTTEVIANITIAPDARECIGAVFATTGDEVVTCWDAFATSPYINLTSPNGGESWMRNSKQYIRWNAMPGMGNFRISLWQNNSQIGIIADNVNSSVGSYAWSVGAYNGGVAPLGSGYTIRIREKGTAVADESDAPFSIVKVSVKTPNGGEFWQIGTTRNITWVAKSISNNLRVVLFKNGVKVGNIVNSIDPALGTYSWTVGNYLGGTATAGSGYQIQIREIGTDAGDRSDATFILTFP